MFDLPSTPLAQMVGSSRLSYLAANHIVQTFTSTRSCSIDISERLDELDS